MLNLIKNADVLVESFRPGVMDSLGLGYGTLSKENPRLIYCSISSYGADGPMTSRVAHDGNTLALVINKNINQSQLHF